MATVEMPNTNKSLSSSEEPDLKYMPGASSDDLSHRKKASFGVVCCRQIPLLMRKNLLLQQRNMAATLSQVGVGFAFILLLLVIKIGKEDVQRKGFPSLMDVTNPIDRPLKLVQCDPSFSVSDDVLFPNEPDHKGCFSFVVAGANETREKDLVLGGHIADVLGFPGYNQVGGFTYVESETFFGTGLADWLLKHKNVTRNGVLVGGAIGWALPDSGEISYTLMYNSTWNCVEGWFGCISAQNETAALQNAVDSAFTRLYASNTIIRNNSRFTASVREMPHQESTNIEDVMENYGSGLFLLAICYVFVIQAWTMIDEKERKLPTMLRHMGMTDSAYWLSWVFSHLITNTVMTLFLTGMAAMFGFQQFLLTDYALIFFCFWLGLLSFTGMALLMSSIVRSASNASSYGLSLTLFYFFMGPLGSALLFGSGDPVVTAVQPMISAVPFVGPVVHFLIIWGRIIREGSGQTAVGMRWEERRTTNILPLYISAAGEVFEPKWTLENSMEWLVISFFIHSILAIYLEKIMPNSYGKRSSVCCCVTQFIKRGAATGAHVHRDNIDLGKFKKDSDDNEVVREAESVKNNEWGDRNVAVELLGLTKIFHGGKLRAVDGIAYGIDNNQLFTLLGHNGAGKTTTINMLVGNMLHSEGDARVFGHSISHDMTAVHQIMGYCPQHDVLYAELTGREHLELFANIKNSIYADAIIDVGAEVVERLQQVNLIACQNVISSAYSGGMQRRLSIAIALIGDPRIVYLDEPTTGMDPVTRRDVWDMIMLAKKGRVIFLTTHSMEEADILGDRIAIMSHGKIQALGSPLELKRKFAVGFRMTAFLKDSQSADAAIQFFSEQLEGIEVIKRLEKAIFFKVPLVDDDPKLIPFFSALEFKKKALGIDDFSVGLATMEEVFLELSKRDLMDSSDFVTLQYQVPEGAEPGMQIEMPLPDGGGSHTIVLGEEPVPGSNMTVRVPKTKINVGDQTTAEEDFGKGTKTFKSTCVALTIKTRQLQCRKKCELAALILFPISMVAIIALIDVLLFDTFRYPPMCGKGIYNKEDCQAKGYNLSCIEQLLELPRPPSASQVWYGTPWYTWFSDMNCGSDTGGTYAEDGKTSLTNGTECYNHLEKLTWDNLRYSAPHSLDAEVGVVSYQTTPELKSWHDNFEYALTSKYCDRTVDWLFDCESVCNYGGDGDDDDDVVREGSGQSTDDPAERLRLSFDYGFDSDPEICQEQCSNLTLTRSVGFGLLWDGEINDDIFGTCKPDLKDSKFEGWRRLQVKNNVNDPEVEDLTADNSNSFVTDSSRRRLANANQWKPLNSSKELMEKINQVGGECYSDWVEQVSRWFVTNDANDPAATTGSFNFINSVDDVVKTEVRKGFLGHFTSSFVEDRSFSEYMYLLMDDKGDDKISINDIVDQVNPLLGLLSGMKKWQSLCSTALSDHFYVQVSYQTSPNVDWSFPIVEVFYIPPSVIDAAILASTGQACPSWARREVKDQSSPLTTSVCNKKFKRETDMLPIEDAIDRTLANNTGITTSSPLKIRQICKYVQNIDAIRNLTMVQSNSLEKDMYETNKRQDMSREIFTNYMQSLDVYHVGYKRHFYEADIAAFNFQELSLKTGVNNYSVYWNLSGSGSDPFPLTQPDVGHWNHLLKMANNMFVQNLTGGSHFIGTVKTQQFPNEFECNRDEFLNDKTGTIKLSCPSLGVDGFLTNLVGYFVGALMLWFYWLPFYSAVQVPVYEKEHRLRMIMRMMGLTSSVYWITMYILEVFKFLLIQTCLYIFCIALDISYFKIHDLSLIYLFVTVWAMVCTMFAFLVSMCLESTKTASAVAFLIFLLLVFCGQELIVFSTINGATSEEFAIFMIVPPWVMFRWAYLFAFQGLVGEGGITWNNWTEIQNGSLVECMQIMIAQWFVLTGMTVWCNFVLPSAGNGSTAPWYFCLLPKYWKKLLSVCHTSQQSINVSVFNPASDDKLPVMLKQQGWYRPKDAEREHQRVITAPVDDDASPKIRVINLHKVFPSKGGAQPKVAVRCVSMGVGSGECFGLLGHNGAGKTTAINMLTGLYPPTSGTAYVGKYHIKDDINKIYADMGVCPQHDLLWPDLYAKEHLEFYGRLKGFSGEKLQRMVSLMLKKVNLTGFANRKAGGFSGGMKRRLSMANALMGGPGVVYMDEPSTGLDPASKHQLWDVIATAKQQGDRSMLLTTHSMEEADVLCERLCIMADGEIQCIGYTHELKRRFGRGYTCMVKIPESTGADGLEKVHAFIKSMFPTANLLNEPIAGCSKYEIDRNEVKLSEVFARMISAKSELGMESWSFTESTLEEVFLKLAALTENFSGGTGLSKTEAGKAVVPMQHQRPLAEMIAEIDAGLGEEKVGDAGDK